MPITKQPFGAHKEVLFIEFKNGDILMTEAREKDSVIHNMLMFSEQSGNTIGQETDEFAGKSSDEIPVQLVMTFSNPASITALIHSLIEIQQELLKPHPQRVEKFKGVKT